MTGCATHRVGMTGQPPFVEVALRQPALTQWWQEPFDTLDLERWRNVPLHGETQYEVTALDGRSCLKASSHNAASILLSPVSFDPDTLEWLSWDWRVDRPVQGEALDRRNGSDVAARVYVYFDTGGLPWQKRSLDYVWSDTLPEGTILSSPFSGESKILVVESGRTHIGQWRHVERNLQDDYARCFGKQRLPKVVAIGLMTDSDNTGQEAAAYYDDLTIARHAEQSSDDDAGTR